MRAPLLPDLPALRGGGKRLLAQTLSLLEIARDTPELAELLDDAAAAPFGHAIGLTGPPGVGKSTLTDALLRDFRKAGESVGVIAVDPSSRASGGALLGDRARIATDPHDKDVFVRSMAARDRLGGLSEDAIAATALMRALFARVLVETVGIGQSEADISLLADTVVLCVQPGSGDSLQFMKAGIMELPDILVVTKSDTGAPARRAASEVEGALSLSLRGDAWHPPVLLVSATQGEGVAALRAAIDRHRAHLGPDGLAAKRERQAGLWIENALREKFGTEGLRSLLRESPARAAARPFGAIARASRELRARLTHSGTGCG